MKDLFGGTLDTSRQPDARGHYWVGIGTPVEHCMRCMRDTSVEGSACMGPPDVAEEVRGLIASWQRETSHLSVGREKHWACQQVLRHGAPAVPVLLEMLREKPAHLSYLLMELTGECPEIPEEHHGRVVEIAQHWVRWGIAKGLIPA